MFEASTSSETSLRATVPRRLVSLALALLGLALEVVMFVPAFLALVLPESGSPPPAPLAGATLAHLAAALLAGLAFQGFPLVTWHPSRGAPALGALAATLALLFPGLGSLWAVCLVLLWPDVARAVVAARSYRDLVDVPLPLEAQMLDARPQFVDRTRRALDVGAFPEFVSHQTEPGVIDMAFRSLGLLARPVMYRLLRRTLSARLPEIRSYAATALSRMEAEFDGELHAADRALAAHPDDRAAKRRLADARLAYLDLGELEDPVRRFHLSEAVRLYEQCLTDAPASERPGLEARLARSLLARGDALRASRVYRRLVESGASDVTLIEAAMQSCLAAGDLAGLARMLVLGRQRRPDVPLLEHRHRVWMGA